MKAVPKVVSLFSQTAPFSILSTLQNPPSLPRSAQLPSLIMTLAVCSGQHRSHEEILKMGETLLDIIRNPRDNEERCVVHLKQDAVIHLQYPHSLLFT